MATAERICYHCGESVPADADLRIELQGQFQFMCCQGCLAVASLITDAGLSNYYRHRQQVAAKANEHAVDAAAAWQTIDQRQELWGVESANGDRDLLLQVSDIRCVACAWLIRSHLEKQPGIIAVQVDVNSGFCRFQWAPDTTRVSEIAKRLFGLGYTPHLPLAQAEEDGRHKERTDSLKRLSVAGLGMMQVMMYAVGLYAGDAFGISAAARGFLSWVSLLVCLPVLLYSGRVFFQGAWRGLRSGKPGMDLPVALAIALAFLASSYHFFLGVGEVWFDSVVMFIFFLSLGRHAELILRQRNLQAGSALARLLPEWANRLADQDRVEVVPASDLRSGDRVRVMTSAAFPADGVLLRGQTEVDESLLTGESLAIGKSVGGAVIAGSINLQQSVDLRVSSNPEDSTVSSLGRLLLSAQARRNDDAGLPGWLVPWFIVVVLCIAMAAWWYWLGHDASRAFAVALAVLVASCPCALSLALPVVRSSASLSLMQQGILLTRPSALFDLLKIKAVVFDKTGTLTLGQPVLVKVEINAERPEFKRDEVLGLAAAMESHSRHAVAQAFREFVPTSGLVEVVNHDGAGLSAQFGNQPLRLGKQKFALDTDDHSVLEDHSLWLADDKGWIARFELNDALRPGAEAMMKQLRTNRLELSICSGDSEMAVSQCARKLAIDSYQSRQTPEDKIEYIKELQSKGTVLMVGDGINDAPVLAAADVSIAVHGASELANSAADIILTGTSLASVTRSMTAARKARKLVNQNLTWALLYNLSILPLAVSGLLQPWMAALGMSASSLLVVLNATRMRSITTADIEPTSSATAAWAQS
ncbi:MAG: heavy metal translocating P-type ATPase [Xanthomonadales bacterium]|nr:heavy metal translocating P-type ATPase [Xanthomonadales bacterium]